MGWRLELRNEHFWNDEDQPVLRMLPQRRRGLGSRQCRLTKAEGGSRHERLADRHIDSRASVVPAPTASANAAASVYTSKNSIITYGNKGEQVTLDVYYTKTAADTWEVAIYDQADAASTTAPFPYASGPVSTTTLNFDPANGDLVSPTSLSFTVPGGQTLNLDISRSSQLASSFAPRAVSIDGNAAADVDHVEVNDKGEIYGIYTNGARVLNFTVPLARVPSPDNLTPVSGNVFSLSGTSGDIQVGTAASLGLGTIVSSALEASTVDIASELTLMIETQRNYTANSKVFQTGAELSDVLVIWCADASGQGCGRGKQHVFDNRPQHGPKQPYGDGGPVGDHLAKRSECRECLGNAQATETRHHGGRWRAAAVGGAGVERCPYVRDARCNVARRGQVGSRFGP